MARKNRRNTKQTRGRRYERRGSTRPCTMCPEGGVDWKDTAALRKYMSDRGKIRGKRVTGLCPNCQRQVSTAIKNAREMALLPYVGSK